MKKVNHILIAIMFNQSLKEDFSFFDLTANVKKEFNKFFASTDPISPPGIDKYAPSEIPRYILQTEDFKYSFAFSPIRFDFHFNELPLLNLTELMKDLKSINDILKNITRDMESVGFRVGIVIDGIMSDNSEFFKTFINKDILEESEECQVSYRTRIKSEMVSEYEYNKWTKYAYSKDDDDIIFQLDLNSIAFAHSMNLTSLEKVITKEIGDFIGS